MEIERIYREFYHEERIASMDVRLDESILATNDDGLKALAMELNGAPKTKGRYVCAEAVTRLLDNPKDSPKWFAERIAEAYKQSKKISVTNSEIIKVLRKIFFEDGKYYLKNANYDPISDGWFTNEPREITMPLNGAVTDALIKCSCWEYDRLLGDWINENDPELCRKIGEHFCDNLRSFNGTGFSDVALWCGCITKCGLSNVKNLAVDYFRNIKGKSYTAWVRRVVQDIPGDDRYHLAEANAILDIARKKKYDWFNIEEFETWAKAMYENLST